MKVLVVCTGNICRSPFAEVYLRRRAGELCLELEVVSAGTYALAGNRATPEAVAVASRLGIDLRAHRAASVDHRAVRGADLVLAMSRHHEEEILDLRGPSTEKPAVYLLGQFHPRPADPPEIPDPLGGSHEDYRRSYLMIQEACDGLLELIRQKKVRF